jgi:peroxiredoxin
MRKLILLLLIFLPFAVFSQAGKFVIKGKIADLNSPATLYLLCHGSITDSAKLKDGIFEFDGQIDQPSTAYLTLNKSGGGFTSDNFVKFYVEAGEIKVSSSDILSEAHITGTKNNDDAERYRALMQPLEKRDSELETKDTGATEAQKSSPAFLQELSIANKQLESERKAVNKQFILNNPSLLVSLDALYSYAQYSGYDDIAALYDKLSPEIKNSREGLTYARTLQRMSAVAVGRIAPDFELPDTNGKLISLSSFKGKYVLLDFWASWCPVCREGNPGILKTYDAFKDKNFTVLGVSLDKADGKSAWLTAIHHDGLKWTQVSELKFWYGKVVKQYNLTALPTNLLIDPDGKIIALDLDGTELAAKLTEVYAGK